MTEPKDDYSKLDIVSTDGAPVPGSIDAPPALNGQAYAGHDLMGRRAPHLRDYVKVLYKRRWPVISTFVLVLLVTTVYTYTAVPIYQARAKLLIEVLEPNYVSFKDVIDPSRQSSDYYQTQYDLLKSRSLARKTIDSLKLWDKLPAATAVSSRGLSSYFGWTIGWIEGLFESDEERSASGPPTPPDETVAQSRAIDALLGTLTIVPVRNSRVVNVVASVKDPELAMRIANAHARGYIDQNTEFKFLSAKDASTWLEQRLAVQRKEVEDAEALLQKYRETHDAIPPEDTENITVQKLGQLSAAYTAAKTHRLDKEAVYNQLRAIQNNPDALDSFPSILNNATVQAQKTELASLRRSEGDLSETLGDNHPRVKAVRGSIDTTEAKLRAEIGNIVQSMKTEYEAARAQEQNLADALQAQKKDALTMNRESIQFGVLKRDVESSRQIYDTLLAKAKETGVTTELRTTNVRVIDPAEMPRGPSSPNRQLNMTFGVFGGLVAGMCLGFLFEYLDSRIKTPDEIKVHLGLPSLGMLPVVHEAHKTDKTVLTGAAWPKLNEALRTVRTNIVFSSAARGSRSILVTSTGPNEGKTTVAGNLGISLAEAGMRVLLIDADLRKPRQHDLFGLEREPGLSNLLVGSSKASECVRKTSVSGLWVLPAGRIPPNPAELLGSSRFRDFLKSLPEHFDWIVIDSPPVMAVADASVIAHLVTGVVFVIGAEMVSRHAAQAAVEQLDNSRAQLMGAILNKVELDRDSYYYSQYYRKEYTDYYTTGQS